MIGSYFSALKRKVLLKQKAVIQYILQLLKCNMTYKVMGHF